MFSYAYTEKPDGLNNPSGLKNYVNINTFLLYMELQQTYS
jgi:hypothetical protein